MRYHLGLAFLLVLVPSFARAAEDVPERLLPASTQIYLRWDGIDAHKDSYTKTSLGQMMKGDTGSFVTGLFDKLQTSAGALLTVESLRRGEDPKTLKKLQADAKAAATLFPLIGKNGFILAGELRQLDQPQGQIYLIFPGMGEKPDPLFGALRLGIGLGKGEIKEEKISGRTVSSLALPPVFLSWWVEGKHAVVTLGTDKPEAVVKTIADGDHARLTDNLLYKRITAFKKFETNSRAFVDVAAFVKMGAKRGKEVSKLLDDLGVMGLKSLVIYSGFEDRAERGLLEFDMPGPRKGLLTLLTGKPFQLGDVPPMPSDVVSFTMTNFDAAVFYDTAYKAAEQIVGLISPDDVPKVKGIAKQADELLGVDLRKDLLGSLGDKFCYYTSPADGPFTLGQTVMFKVKDAEKLETTLEQVIKNLGNASGKQVRIKKREYHGVALHEVYVTQQGFFFVPTYAIHKDWLIVGFFPQAVQAYIQRSKGELAVWKPSPVVKESLDKLPKEFLSISYTDPRPSVKQLMSIAPLIGGLVSSFNPQLNFEVGTLPATQEVTKHLFPNLSVTSDDGKTLRQDSRDSLSLPFDVTGLDTYSLFFLFALFGRVAF
ncbi:MAG TPA: hypothetical protein VH643_02570 [Gemmataceae bacterium]|jgi:hypothetical protein